LLPDLKKVATHNLAWQEFRYVLENKGECYTLIDILLALATVKGVVKRPTRKKKSTPKETDAE
jgi:hypothetical protein